MTFLSKKKQLLIDQEIMHEAKLILYWFYEVHVL